MRAKLVRIEAVLLWALVVLSASGQPTAFTYQGRLNDGNGPANGLYDFKFTLYDSTNSTGAAVAGPLTNVATTVSQGAFTVALDFGPAFDGDPRWLEIAVQTNGGNAFTTLAPRQAILASPMALYALNGAWPTNATPSPGSITGVELAPQSVSVTNLALGESLGIVGGNIQAYGVRRFAWSRAWSRFSCMTNLFFFSTIGSGWAEDSESGGVLTNILALRPFAGVASPIWYQAPVYFAYGPNTGADTALWQNGDDTNWHGGYFVLTNTGNITSPIATGFSPSDLIVSDVLGVSYLANPNGGSFVVEIRTNGAYAPGFLDLDSNWMVVASANAAKDVWQGVTVWWTNSRPVLTQLRVRATGPGWTPIVSEAQWNSTITNGVVLSQYSHQGSGPWWDYTDPAKVFPIWSAWRPDLIMLTGGLGDTRTNDTATELALMKTGFPDTDIIDIGVHENVDAYTDAFERQYCFDHGMPYFDGQAASIALWGSVSNGTALGLYQGDGTHLTSAGYAAFGQMLWDWLDLTSAPR